MLLLYYTLYFNQINVLVIFDQNVSSLINEIKNTVHKFQRNNSYSQYKWLLDNIFWKWTVSMCVEMPQYRNCFCYRCYCFVKRYMPYWLMSQEAFFFLLKVTKITFTWNLSKQLCSCTKKYKLPNNVIFAGIKLGNLWLPLIITRKNPLPSTNGLNCFKWLCFYVYAPDRTFKMYISVSKCSLWVSGIICCFSLVITLRL